MRVLALFLIIRAVYTDSVACAISAGTLYMGGFDNILHLKNFLTNKQNPNPEVLPPQTPNNVVQLHHRR
ncbi:MAG: hypothetical protein EOP10_21165 [Proteobacteria bacterium]|nr:MAG: hypothetical protein EOP10_21165 [Pseudomonadota bacterium]